MESATDIHYGNGINGECVSVKLPAAGEVIKMRTGSPRTNDLRWVIGEVVGHRTRSIPGTQFAVREVVVETAAGEQVASGPGRIREITGDEIRAYRAEAAIKQEWIEQAAAAMKERGLAVDPGRPELVVGYIAAVRHGGKTGAALTAHANRAASTARIRLQGGSVAACLLAVALMVRTHAALRQLDHAGHDWDVYHVPAAGGGWKREQIGPRSAADARAAALREQGARQVKVTPRLRSLWAALADISDDA